MTTIAWDGKVLAADTRRTLRDEQTDGVVKIRIYPPGKVLMGKKPSKEAKDSSDAVDSLYVMAGAGNAELIRKISAAVEKGGWNSIVNHGRIWRAVVGGMKDAYRAVGARVMAISATEVHCMVATTCGVEDVLTYKRTEKVAIGSGGKIAQFLMEQFDLTAQEAVAGAALTDLSTGGHVHSVLLKGNKGIIQPDILLDDVNACRRSLQASIKCCKVPRTKRPFDRHVIVDLT